MNFIGLQSIVREGLSKLSAKPKPDPDLQVYDKLEPADFADIISKYGVDDTIAYIRKMEDMRGKNG